MTPRRPSVEYLLRWLKGELPADELAAVDADIERDPDIARTLRWLRVLMTDDHLLMEEPPALLGQQLEQAFRRERGDGSSDPDEFIAELLLDSRRDLVGQRTRGTNDADTSFQLAYGCDAGDVILDVERHDADRLRVRGHVLLADTNAPLCEATITGPAYTLRTVDGDVFGRFELWPVPPTANELVVDNGELRVRMALALD